MADDGFSTVELNKFSAAGRTIAAAVGTSVQVWARAEAGVVLKQCAGKTKVGSEKKATLGGIMRAYRHARRGAGFGNDKNKGRTGPGEASINLGIRGGVDGKVYYRTRKAGLAGGRRGFQDVYGPGFSRGKRIASQDWPLVARLVAKYREEVEPLIAAGTRAVGLARQSWVQIADDLGIRLENVKGGGTLSARGLKKARDALASNGNPYRNGYGVIGSNAKEFYVTLVNRYPRMGALFMDATLQRVIMGRLGYFQRHLEEGTFLSARAAAKAYPYVEVLRNAA
jgi:hypothetical protein